MDIPESSRTSSGRAILNLVNMSQDDTVTAVIPVSEEDLKRGGDSTVDPDDDAPESAEASEEEELVGGAAGDEDYFVMLTTHGIKLDSGNAFLSDLRKLADWHLLDEAMRC